MNQTAKGQYSYIASWIMEFHSTLVFVLGIYFMQDVLPRVSDLWPRTIDTGQYVGTIFLGLAKAFDCACVNHQDMHIIIIIIAAEAESLWYLGRCI